MSFVSLPDLVRRHARERPSHTALIQEDSSGIARMRADSGAVAWFTARELAVVVDRPHATPEPVDIDRVKTSTSAPFAAALKAEVVRRWPGRLVDSYGLTEGGGTCFLDCSAYPDKLHTVGRPAPGHDIRLIDDAGVEVAAGETGEVVGHSSGENTSSAARELQAAVNARLAKTQRIASLQIVGALPRSLIGKVLKRELRDRWIAETVKTR